MLFVFLASESHSSVIGVCVIFRLFLQGTPKQVKDAPIAVVFLPIFIFQGVAMCFYFVRVVENFISLVGSNGSGIREEMFPYFNTVKEFCGFLDHGSR